MGLLDLDAGVLNGIGQGLIAGVEGYDKGVDRREREEDRRVKRLSLMAQADAAKSRAEAEKLKQTQLKQELGFKRGDMEIKGADKGLVPKFDEITGEYLGMTYDPNRIRVDPKQELEMKLLQVEANAKGIKIDSEEIKQAAEAAKQGYFPVIDGSGQKVRLPNGKVDYRYNQQAHEAFLAGQQAANQKQGLLNNQTVVKTDDIAVTTKGKQQDQALDEQFEPAERQAGIDNKKAGTEKTLEETKVVAPKAEAAINNQNANTGLIGTKTQGQNIKNRLDDKYGGKKIESEINRNNRSGRGRGRGAGVGSNEFKMLPKEKQIQVEQLAKKMAHKQSIRATIAQTYKQLKDPNVPINQKITAGEEILKTLNSLEGPDAIQESDYKRLAGMLKSNFFNVTGPGKTFGRDLQGFTTQVGNNIKRLDGALSANQAQIDRLYGRATEAPPQSAAPAKPSGLVKGTAQSNQFKMVNGKKYEKTNGGWQLAK